ncbi:C40 family peptidase [Streptomyces sp. PTM05]|uniref:C40 family peptidase n=1 Tax=Streptantibioticus parmotrematis TaxID=2873249 RepID=A0ABS7QQH6_9ACTN|nr:NlpC/P60 family protein [Streptantibioticus parmotrematis]MBY8885443.1 C40 family peptidase [Streptantibioticus parmotrematis]
MPTPSHPDAPRGRPSRRAVLTVAGGVAAAAVAGGCLLELGGGDRKGHDGPPPLSRLYRFQRLTGPGRTVVRDSHGKTLAVLTDGARTALMAGPTRTFSEPHTTSATVRHGMWVRLMPAPWAQESENAAWFARWFPHALTDRSADVLAVAFQYAHGAPDQYDPSGLRYAGAASYGPRTPGQPGDSAQARQEGSDFYDYLGIPWTFPDSSAEPDRSRYGDVDCSGFMRLVWGYRTGLPLHGTNGPGPGLPRRAFAIAAYGPGALLTRATSGPPADAGMLQPGDLVFFAIDSGHPSFVDHCGLYLGKDDAGHGRFYSSRIVADGPTMGDVAGPSVIDGNSFYAQGFRAARRL